MSKIHKIDVLDKGYVRYVDHFGSDMRVVEAARVSYGSPSKGEEADKKLLFYLYKNRHTSPFEQCSITFNIKLPLFVQAQMVRHRTQKLNQKSARYSEMADEFYFPSSWRRQHATNKQASEISDEPFNPVLNMRSTRRDLLNGKGFTYTCFIGGALANLCEDAYKIYQAMLEAGVAREMARMVLPQNLYTEIYTTWDLHNLMHFFTLRIDDHAQYETRQYAEAMLKITEQYFPWTIEAFRKFKFKLVEIE